MRHFAVVASILACLISPSAFTAECSGNDPILQVLGSGGPIADDDRASSGYLLWHGGQARMLVDAGGGVFQRFGEAGASLDILDLIALTHVHTDHSADLPALLKGAYFADRSRPLPVAGPTGSAPFPGVEAFLERQFGADAGAYAYLSGLLDGSDRLFELVPVEIDRSARSAVAVIDTDTLTVDAIGLHHGPVPSLAYRIEIDGRRFVISGDQNLSTEGFIEFAKGADVLVMPMAIPERAGGAATNLHARPSQIGRAAAQAQVDHLVLSHFMARSLRNLQTQVDHVRAHYKGELTLAEDLTCVP